MTTEIVELLSELIGFPTTSNRPVDAIAASLSRRAEDAGGRVESVQTEPGKHNVIARFGPAGTDGLIISGHMDVVPTEGQPWSSDPFVLTRRDNLLYGRGTADMKGFIACVTAALKHLNPEHLRRELVLIWTHDEEVGCLGSRALAKHYTDPLPSHAWIGEPTNFQMCRMHPGHTTVSIECTGRAAHSSRPSLGLNAIQIASRAIAQLEGLADHWRQKRRFEEHLVSPFTVLNVGQISGGQAVNIVPDHCTIRLGFRPLPGDDARQRVQEIEECLEPVRQHAHFGGGNVEVHIDQIAPALLTPEGTPLEHALCPHAAEPRPTAAPFATDGGNLQDMGIASMIFGPGGIDVAHRADEHIDPLELERCGQIALSVIERFCISPETPA